MKKTFSIFMFCISLLLFPSALVRADGGSLIPSDNEITVTPSLSQTDIDNANSIGYLFEILRQGGSIDCTNAEDGYDLDDLVDDFYTNIWDKWRDLTGSTDTVYWLNPFSDDIIQSQSVVLCKPNDQLYKTIKPLRNWLNQPRDDNGDIIPTPTPPVDYSNQVSAIIHSYAYIYNILEYPWYQRYESSHTENWRIDYPSNISFFSSSNLVTTLPSDYYFSEGIASLYINTTTNTLSVTNFSGNPLGYYKTAYVNPPVDYAYGNYLNRFSFDSSRQIFTNGNYMPGIATPSWQQSFTTFDDAINYCYYHFRNCNIYVDGVPWGLINEPNHSVGIGGGTYVDGTNQPVEYTYDIDIYIPLDDIIDRLDTLIRQKQVITYPDISDLIVDVNGQPAVAVVDVSHETVDDWYVKNVLEYIPIFPMSVSYPVSDSEMVSIIEPAVSVIPDDIITVLGILFIGGLFVCLMQRLLE